MLIANIKSLEASQLLPIVTWYSLNRWIGLLLLKIYTDQIWAICYLTGRLQYVFYKFPVRFMPSKVDSRKIYLLPFAHTSHIVILQVLTESKSTIVTVGFSPTDEFPEDEDVRDSEYYVLKF